MSLGALAASLFLLVALARPATAVVPKVETRGPTAATLLITCDRRIASPESVILPDPPRLILDIPNAFCVPQQPIQLAKGGPVLKVQSFQYREHPVRIARVVVDLETLLPYHVEVTGNQLKVFVEEMVVRPVEIPRIVKAPEAAIAKPLKPLAAVLLDVETHGPTSATLVVTSDGPIASPESFILSDPPRLVIDIPNAVAVPQQPIRLPWGGPILKVQSSQYRERPVRVARVVVDLATSMPYQVKVVGNQLKVVVGAVEAPTLAKVPKATVPTPAAPEPLTAEVPATAKVPEGTLPMPASVLEPPVGEAVKPSETPKLAKVPEVTVPTPVAPEPLSVEAPGPAEAPREEAKREPPPEERMTKFELHPVKVAGHTLLNVPVRSLVELRFKNVVRQAYDISCGAAALATLLKYYYGEEVTEGEIIAAMLELGDKEKIQKEGFSLLEMKRFAERRGYVAGGYRITDVDKLTNLKVPAITLINVRGYAHFAVIKGVAQGQVFIADPAFGNRSRPLESFGGEWNNVILVVLSDSRSPTSAFTLDPTLKAPVRDVMVIVDRGLRTIGPAAGEF